MTPVDQSVTACPRRNDGHAADGTPGDCFRAALATILDLELGEVPHVVQHLSWWAEARRFVRAHTGGWLDLGAWTPAHPPYGEPGEAMRWPFYLPADLDAWTPPYVIASGPSPRGPFHHSVVVHQATGALAHDPHPSRAGILAVTDVIALVATYDPAPPAPLALEAGA